MDGSGTADRVDRAAHAREPVDVLGISKRLQKDPRWLTAIEPLRTKMMRDCRKQGMSKPDAQAWTYSELERLYALRDTEEMPATAAVAESGVSGLGRIPDGWPVLPSNASLQAEIAWVQASRLDVVEESGDATRVDLSRARSPAPSRASIGWLETSIRAYSKYCDIAAKATAQQEHEAEAVRRERMAIAEVRALLESMTGENPGG